MSKKLVALNHPRTTLRPDSLSSVKTVSILILLACSLAAPAASAAVSRTPPPARMTAVELARWQPWRIVGTNLYDLSSIIEAEESGQTNTLGLPHFKLNYTHGLRKGDHSMGIHSGPPVQFFERSAAAAASSAFLSAPPGGQLAIIGAIQIADKTNLTVGQFNSLDATTRANVMAIRKAMRLRTYTPSNMVVVINLPHIRAGKTVKKNDQVQFYAVPCGQYNDANGNPWTRYDFGTTPTAAEMPTFTSYIKVFPTAMTRQAIIRAK